MVASKKGKETPAEQLLRMIEGAPGAEGLTNATPVSAFRHLLDTVQDACHRLWQRVVPMRKDADTFLWNLRLVQRVLWVLLAGFGAYVALDLVFIQPGPSVSRVSTTKIETPAESTPTESAEVQRTLKPLSEYLAGVQAHNPFTGLIGAVGGAVQSAKSAKQRLEDLSSKLVVVGIDRGPRPEAIIEDSAQQRTYFVKVGDEINGLMVKEINTSGVVVTYEGEELLLK